MRNTIEAVPISENELKKIKKPAKK